MDDAKNWISIFCSEWLVLALTVKIIVEFIIIIVCTGISGCCYKWRRRGFVLTVYLARVYVIGQLHLTQVIGYARGG